MSDTHRELTPEELEARVYATQLLEEEEAMFNHKIAGVMSAARRYLSDAAARGDDSDSFTLDVVADFYLNYVPIKAAPWCSTMGTNHKEIFYGPRFIASLYDEAICGEIAVGDGATDGSARRRIRDVLTEEFGGSLDTAREFAFWKAAREQAEKVFVGGGGQGHGRRASWAAGLVAAELVKDELTADEIRKVNRIDEAFMAESAVRRSVQDRFVGYVSSILLHEVLHIIRGDVVGEDKYRQEFIWQSGPPEIKGEKVSDPSGAELHQMLNRAQDSVINDTIENELLKSVANRRQRGNDKDRILPGWVVRRENARFTETRDIYREVVTKSCQGMWGALGKEGEFIAPEWIVDLEREFRKLFDESINAQKEIEKEKRQGQQGQGQGQQGQGQGQGESQEQDQGQGEGQGQGQEEGEKEEQEQGQGQGQNQSQGEQGGGGEGDDSPEQGEEGSDPNSDSGSGSGSSADDWSEWHEKNPRRHIHNAISKVFGGDPMPPRSDEPPQKPESGAGAGQGEGEGTGEGTPEEWNDYPGKPVDNHDTTREETTKETERSGEDPLEERDDVLKPVIRKHQEKSPTRKRGHGSALADILVGIISEDDLPPPSFEEILSDNLLNSIFSTLVRQSFDRFPPHIYGIAPQFGQHGLGLCLPDYRNIKNKGRVTLAIDVSGSMGNEDVRTAIKETLSFIRALGPEHEITIVQVDDGIVDWKTFESGGYEYEDFIESLETEGFFRHGAGGTGYEDLFDVISRGENMLPTEYTPRIPETFSGRDYGVPERVPPQDILMVFTDWGFSDSDLAKLERTELFWVGVTSRPSFAEPRQGKVIDCEDLVSKKRPGEPVMAM